MRGQVRHAPHVAKRTISVHTAVIRPHGEQQALLVVDTERADRICSSNTPAGFAVFLVDVSTMALSTGHTVCPQETRTLLKM